MDSSSEGHLQILFLVLGLKEFAFQGLKIKVREHSKQDEDVVDFSPLLRKGLEIVNRPWSFPSLFILHNATT